MKPDFQNNTVEPGWRSSLRREMLARRAALTPETHAQYSAAIVAQLCQIADITPGTVIGFCWPIRNEADILPAIYHWQAQGCTTSVAVTGALGTALSFREWQAETPMQADRYGIPTPQYGECLTPTVLIIPVNAFDLAGYRLGYGGGYFDRTLVALHPKPLAIGVGFEFSRVDSIRPHPFDHRLDRMVTEAGIFSYEA